MAFTKGQGGCPATWFRKGRSGNPGGRPKVIREVQELARQYGAEAIETLADIMRNGKSDSARVAAACAILDRGYGKAPQTIHTDPQRPLVHYTDEELMAMIAEYREEEASEDDDASSEVH